LRPKADTLGETYPISGGLKGRESSGVLAARQPPSGLHLFPGHRPSASAHPLIHVSVLRA